MSNSINQPNIQKLENPIQEFNPEELEKLGGDPETNKEISPEQTLEELQKQTTETQQEIDNVSASVEKTKSELESVREGLGLPPIEEKPPSVVSGEEKLKLLQDEKEALEKQVEEIITAKEREDLIEKEKEKILQEKINKLFEEFESFGPEDIESIKTTGKTKEQQPITTKSMGKLDPELAMSLFGAFKQGITLLPEILENLKELPELLKKFDEDIEKEAQERVDKRLEELKDEIKESLDGEEDVMGKENKDNEGAKQEMQDAEQGNLIKKTTPQSNSSSSSSTLSSQTSSS